MASKQRCERFSGWGPYQISLWYEPAISSAAACADGLGQGQAVRHLPQILRSLGRVGIQEIAPAANFRDDDVVFGKGAGRCRGSVGRPGDRRGGSRRRDIRACGGPELVLPDPGERQRRALPGGSLSTGRRAQPLGPATAARDGPWGGRDRSSDASEEPTAVGIGCVHGGLPDVPWCVDVGFLSSRCGAVARRAWFVSWFASAVSVAL